MRELRQRGGCSASVSRALLTAPDNLGGALVAMEPRWVELYLGQRSHVGGSDEWEHVPLGGYVMRLNRSERATAASRLLSKCLMGTEDSPDNLGGALVAVEPRWVELYLRRNEAKSVEASTDERARAIRLLRHEIESLSGRYSNMQTAW